MMNIKNYRIRSYVCRNSRKTAAQKKAYETLQAKYVIDFESSLQPQMIFNSDNPVSIEIGFGSGQSLFELAKREPHKNFIGIETHQPGIGALLLAIEQAGLTNLKIIEGDATLYFENRIHDETLEKVLLFFPDPWPKRKHHPRRIIRKEFVDLLCQKLEMQGELHLATDWEDYAKHMVSVISGSEGFTLISAKDMSQRSENRPIITKFERRAIQSGRKIYDLQYRKK